MGENKSVHKKRRSSILELSKKEIDENNSPSKKARRLSEALGVMGKRASLNNSVTEKNDAPISPKKNYVLSPGSPKKNGKVSLSTGKKNSPIKTMTETLEDDDSSDSSLSEEVFKSPMQKMNKSLNAKSAKSDSEEDCSDFDMDITETDFTSLSKATTKESRGPEDDLIFGWTKEDTETLINKMGKILPKKDAVRFNVRSKKILWTKVEFGDHSASDCSEHWFKIEPLLRPHRILKEVLADALEWVKNPVLDVKKMLKDYPDLPKKPMTSYLLFAQEIKAKLMKKNPQLPLVELAKLTGEKFRALSDEKKEKYRQKAKELNEKYQEKMESFFKDHPEMAVIVSKHENNKKTAKKETQKVHPPRKPLAPFKLYCKEKLDSKGVKGQIKESDLRAEWNALSAKKKMVWIKKAQEKEQEYLEELEVFKKEHPDYQGIMKFKSVLSKDDEAVIDKLEGKPEPPPKTAYALFSSIMFQDPELKSSAPSIAERVKEIGKLWQQVSDEEKQSYTDKVKEMTEEYEKKFKEYLNSLPPEKRALELSKNKKKEKTVQPSSATGKKMKQMTLAETFKSKNGAKVKEEGPNKDEGESEADESDDEDMDDEDDFLDDDDVQNKMKARLLEKQPKVPPKSGMELFKSRFLSKKPGISPAKINKKWKSLPDKSKEKYSSQVDKLKSDYLKDFKKFIEGLSVDELKIYKSLDKNEVVNDPDDSDEELDDSD